jgi:hypothetical protein
VATPRIVWDEDKETVNRRKHDVGFWEALEAILDPLARSVRDETHSVEEERWTTVGMSGVGRLLRVTTAEAGATIRILSARPASAGERRDYEEEA